MADRSPRTPLRAVKATERKRPTTKKQTVQQAAASGDHKALLIAMRERIAAAVSSPTCPPRDLAALTRRLQDIAKEIEAIELREKQEGEDADAGPAPDEAFDPEAI